MANIEDILNQAQIELKKGVSVKEIVSKYPEFSEDLEPLLEVSQMLYNLPKAEAPQPSMQRKYALSPARHLWFAWLSITRFAVSASVVLLLTGLVGTGYAAYNSVPGKTLFALKKSSEQLRLKFATSQEDKANLQVQITQKRLFEAEQIFNNPQSNVKMERAALSELLKETKNSIDAVDAAAKNNSLTQQDHPIVTTLENITKKQQALLTQVEPQNQISLAAKDALATTQENANKVEEIKRYILAANNEQTLTELDADPNAVVIIGNVALNSTDKIIVEKTVFIVNEQTRVKDLSGNLAKLDDIKVQDKVRVIANKDGDELFALLIILINSGASQNGSVESASTTTSSTSTDSKIENKEASTSTLLNIIKEPVEQELIKNPNTAVGGIIPEDPTPQSSSY